jgi:hypothetical protein
MNIVESYGRCVSAYEGTGAFTFRNGKRFGCEFHAGQLLDSTIVLLCKSLPNQYFPFELDEDLQFEGQSLDGTRVNSRGKVSGINILDSRLDRPGSQVALTVDEFVATESDESPKYLRFGLTNFKFSGQRISFDGRWHDSLPLRLIEQPDWHLVHLRTVEDYKRTMLRVQTLKSIEVTCTAEVEVEKFGGIENIEKIIGVINRLCLITSVARGTKIQWIYYDRLDKDRQPFSRCHARRVTKPYCPLSVIDYRRDDNATRIFIETAYPAFCERNKDFELDMGSIDSYLDAKSESDYLETRGAKLAVALEGLKHAFIHRSTSLVSEFVISEEKFETLKAELMTAIDNVLKSDLDIDKSQRQSLADKNKVLGLNRRSFGSILGKLFQEINFQPSRKETDLFVRSRNKLVHAADFYCRAATSTERADCEPLSTPFEEYCFMVNFLDRIFLKLLNYSGEYVHIGKLIKGEDGIERVDP